jgi:hypothetical protein
MLNVLPTTWCSRATSTKLFQYLSLKAMKKLMLHLFIFFIIHIGYMITQFVCKINCLAHQTWFLPLFPSFDSTLSPSYPHMLPSMVHIMFCMLCHSAVWFSRSIVHSLTRHPCPPYFRWILRQSYSPPHHLIYGFVILACLQVLGAHSYREVFC